MYVSVITSKFSDRENTELLILGPLFLTEQQLMTPKETGPRFRETSPHTTKVEQRSPLNWVAVGLCFTLWQQLVPLKEQGCNRLEP